MVGWSARALIEFRLDARHFNQFSFSCLSVCPFIPLLPQHPQSPEIGSCIQVLGSVLCKNSCRPSKNSISASCSRNLSGVVGIGIWTKIPLLCSHWAARTGLPLPRQFSERDFPAKQPICLISICQRSIECMLHLTQNLCHDCPDNFTVPNHAQFQM